MTHGLTLRQSEALSFIGSYQTIHGFAPSFDEIATAMGLKSKSNAHRIVHQLIDRGAVQMMPARARSISLVKGEAA